MLVSVLAVAMLAAASAAAATPSAPVTSADLVTPGSEYAKTMPKGLESWASVLADVFVNKVSSPWFLHPANSA